MLALGELPSSTEALAAVAPADLITPATPIDGVRIRARLHLLSANQRVVDGCSCFPSARLAEDHSAGQLRVRFSPVEQLVYGVLAARFAGPVSRSEIEDVVWRGRLSSRKARHSNVIDVYVRYLTVKLGKSAPHLAIETIRGVGCRLRERACRPTSVAEHGRGID